MKSAAIGLVVLLAAGFAFAQEPPLPPPPDPGTVAPEPVATPPDPSIVLSVGGRLTWAVGINGHAVGWYFNEARHNVTVSAHLGNGGGHAYLDAYLTRNIGPGTTEDDEIARISLDLAYPHDGWVDLFTNLELERGTYWLIIAKPRERAHSSLNWFVAQPGELHGPCGVSIHYLGSRSYTFHGDAAEYIPASKFEKKYEPYMFQFEVRADGNNIPDC